VSGLKVVFRTDDGLVQAVDTMDLNIGEGEKLGPIGESGCGKTVFSHAIMRLLGDMTKVTGSIAFRGKTCTRWIGSPCAGSGARRRRRL
jgi:ABC-type dipeptide/oligopeptide/nickel transport system ATPase component